MCGIAGIYNLDQQPVEEVVLKRLTDAIAHRGPDGEGFWFNENRNVGLGQRRLAILDLSTNGRQPMSYLNDRFWITFNGEVFNFLEIKQELLDKNYQFVSDSDTEVILAAYAEWGEGMLNKFNGMWALAIYDQKDNKLLLSRDRFGIKPLYYYLNDDTLMFASEVQAIHKILGKNAPLNISVIKEIARGGFANHSSKETYLKDVYSLPHGHNLTIQYGKVSIDKWYYLRLFKPPAEFTAQVDRFKELLVDSCKLRLRSDVPLGTCLSGGVDSGSIVSVVNNLKAEGARFSHYTHRAFCASFPGSQIDETSKAKKLSSDLGATLDVVEIEPNEQELEEAMRQCDGPMHALAFFPIWKLYKHIRGQGISVTLDGQGPDEMLGGYRPLPEALIAALQRFDAKWFEDVYETYASQGENSQFSSRQFARKVKRRLPVYFIKYYLKRFLRFLGFRDDFIEENYQELRQFKNYLDESLYLQFFKDPLPGILNQYDRCSMGSGVECRMPFMDYRLVEFIFSLPPESKVGSGYTKRVLRVAMQGIVPDEIRLNKTKLGFNAPLVEWFRGPLKQFMLKYMNSREFMESPYFDGKQLKENFEDFLASTTPQWSDAWQFWPSVHLTWWLNYVRQNY
ncbi:MAG: asparagine synthase (glutamine-hydrolyzing) [Candidatus Magasanikbacteria bacterium RIFOXYC2_FULL_42_28]|uniref:asparagine synthase (glutamine-hydrolyzing) n=1 Tax=Candidatus Magasanikbacteria bacterium RIFOXYC2_FULL_42_28 TaxID=1798704 RepID=A0A1F6NXL6_9BACT|nr:MAG: asparagine synthase (glutamine-hydrolyzing) [Candidatus Magasanikbacteria bacterium RIFOXYC2_FULL_42_28]